MFHSSSSLVLRFLYFYDLLRQECCSVCLPGYASRSKIGLCHPCPARGPTLVLFTIACFAIIGLFAYLVYDSLDGAKEIASTMVLMRQKEIAIPSNFFHRDDDDDGNAHMPFHTIAIRIVSSFLQMSSMLLSFDIALPTSVTNLLHIESSVSSLSSELMNFDCATDQRDDGEMFLIKQIMAVWVVPFIATTLCAAFWFIFSLVRKCKGKKEAKQTKEIKSDTTTGEEKVKEEKVEEEKVEEISVDAFDGFIASLMVLFYTLFPSVLNRVALTLSCRKFHDKTLLTEALSITCGEDQHIAIISLVGIPGMFLYALIVGLICSWTLT